VVLEGVTLNNASDYGTNGLYQTPNPNPSPFICQSNSPSAQQSITQQSDIAH